MEIISQEQIITPLKIHILTVDLHFGNELITPITFECDGGEAIFETPEYSLFRLNSGCN